MAATTKIQAFGNSLGVTLNKDVLATAGFARSDEVRVEATRDRVVITRPDSDYAKAMDGFRKAAARYPGAMAELAE
ncbi:MAG: AbrB/MazE/SpoVT family DNA-binding domain-containing protein [Alphaproteobacteria bacterium]|nr:AbrB/MazE/SpoVT family DNA-binding domain-containing protein [Alphaproteobacteria bacterium]